jgi:hypothetical protein
MVKFMQKWTPVTSELYYETLEKLHKVIQNKILRMLTFGVVHFHDSARQYITTPTRALLGHYNASLTTLLTALISLRRTTICLPT